jgi:L-alanine-DL-glutamate epimerase-like enolase superfamily enzyme
MTQLQIETESWPYKTPFRVSRGAEAALEVVVVTLTDAWGHVGRGEAAGVDYDGETIPSLVIQLEALRADIERFDTEAQADFAQVAKLLPPGGARNALDCALWDLAAKRRAVSVWQLALIPRPQPLITCITLGIDTPEAVARGARQYADWPMIKVKVDGRRALEPVQLVHRICPAAKIIVDPNQAWDCKLLNELAPELHSLGVVLVEQPVPRGSDETLRDYTGALALAADESLAERSGLAGIKELYQVVNIKLDKAGGLSEALALARDARREGLAIMVGCMAGTSLAMAPGMVVGQGAEFIDLDGPLLHARDRPHGIAYDTGSMGLPSPELWG